MSSERKFIDQEIDKFTGVTITKSKKHPYSADTGVIYGTLQFYFSIRMISSNNHNQLFIDTHLFNHHGSWLNISRGKILIKTDTEVITSAASENYHNVEQSTLVESVHYKISQNDFLKICNSQNISIRVIGDFSCDIEEKPCRSVILMCQQFYNNVFDESKYIESINVKSCFIATAAMGNEDHPHVIELRLFRDQWLNTSSLGKKFILSYYKYGSIASRYIEKNNLFKFLTMLLIVKPLVMISRIINKF